MTRDKIRNIIALIIILFTFGYFILISLPNYTAKSDPIIIGIQSALVGLLTLVVSSYFRGSKDENNKS